MLGAGNHLRASGRPDQPRTWRDLPRGPPEIARSVW